MDRLFRCREAWNHPCDVPARSRSDVQVTLSQAYDRYRHSKQHHRSIKEIDRIFAHYILPVFGTSKLAAINRTDVTGLLDQIAFGNLRPAPVMARAVAAQLSAFFSWALARWSFLEENPCRLASRPPKPHPRSRILSDKEVRGLWRVLDEEAMPWKHAIRLILLTGQRRGEVFGADWGEFDLDRRLWTIPAARSKNGREHRVPLSAPATELIRTIPNTASGKLFPARGHPTRSASGFSKAMKRITRAVLVQTGGSTGFTLHDLRRTVATGLQRLGVRLEVTEAVLNHVSGSRDGVVGIYQLYQFDDEKRVALDRWAGELARLISRSGHFGLCRLGQSRCP